MTDRDNHLGPLLLPLAPSNAAAPKAVEKTLRGHATAANWLPEGLWPELDELRAEQLRLRDQVVAELATLDALAMRFRSQDEEHEQQLRQAHRQGRPSSIEDRRTPPEQRQAERAEVEERLWAGVMVLAEVVESVVALFREREDDWLADLRSQLEPAREKRREAERLLAEARAEEWQLFKLGDWVQKTSEAGPFGLQPAPTPSPPPVQFNPEVQRSMLEVPWHRERPWKAGEREEPVPSWHDLSERAAVAEGATPEDDDPTGQVSALVERESDEAVS